MPSLTVKTQSLLRKIMMAGQVSREKNQPALQSRIQAAQRTAINQKDHLVSRRLAAIAVRRGTSVKVASKSLSRNAMVPVTAQNVHSTSHPLAVTAARRVKNAQVALKNLFQNVTEIVSARNVRLTSLHLMATNVRHVRNAQVASKNLLQNVMVIVSAQSGLLTSHSARMHAHEKMMTVSHVKK